MNQYGEHKLGKTWSRELALVAKNCWLLSGMKPGDVAAILASADRLVGSRTALRGRDLLHLRIAAWLKLPHGVEAWMPWMREPGTPVVTEGGPAEIRGPKSAADFVRCACELAAALSGVVANWEYDQLLGKSPPIFHYGPRAFFQKLGMLQHRGDHAAQITTTCLGKNDQNTDVFCNAGVWEDIMARVDAFDGRPRRFSTAAGGRRDPRVC